MWAAEGADDVYTIRQPTGRIMLFLNYSNDPVFSEWFIRSGLEIKILSAFLTCVSYGCVCVCVCVLQVPTFPPSLSDYRNNIRHIGRQLKQFVTMQCFPSSVTCCPIRKNVTRGVLRSVRGGTDHVRSIRVFRRIILKWIGFTWLSIITCIGLS